MHQFIYTSRAVTPFTDDELTQLLERARAFNAVHDLTGMLLYYRDDALDNGAFMQYIEGPVEAVRLVMKERIESDLRHRGIVTFVDEPREGRLFADWRMAFPLDASSSMPKGFVELMDAELPQTEHTELALRLLHKFRETAASSDGRIHTG